jgi:hypothetical protein
MSSNLSSYHYYATPFDEVLPLSIDQPGLDRA